MPAILSLPLPWPSPVKGEKAFDDTKNDLGPGIDFGTVVIWSCPNSCPINSKLGMVIKPVNILRVYFLQYVGVCKEYVVVQPPADVILDDNKIET
jgi:hypothetical protein